MRARGSHVWWAFALGLVAGCNQILGLDLPAGNDDVNDARDHDAYVIDGPADRDGDGVIDGDDVCPDVFDPGQHDEDRDGRGDRCDLCPHLAQADDTDRDEDNIPDACDPYPATSAGRLRWSGFHSADEMFEWQGTGSGTATWTDDGVLLAPDLDGEVRLVRIDSGNTRTRTRVIASLQIGAPNAGGSARRAVGVTIHLDAAAGGNFFLCQIETDLPVTSVRLQEYRLQSGTGAATIATATIGTVYPAGDALLDFDLGADSDADTTIGAACRLGIGAATSGLPRAPVVDLPAGLSGVRTVGVPVHVRWVVIIDHPAPGTTN